MALPFSPPPPPPAPINPNLDPNLVPRMQNLSPPGSQSQLPARMRNNLNGGSPSLQGSGGILGSNSVQGFAGTGNMWAGAGGFDAAGAGMHDAHSPSDSWSNSSLQGPAVPTTLNVEDWFQFFGINGSDMSGMNNDIPLGDHSYK